MFSGGNDFTMPVMPAYGNGNNGGMGGWGDGGWWVLIILLALFGGFGNGFGGWGGNSGSNGGVMDAYVLNSDFATLQRQIDSGFSGVTAGINQVNQGLCNGFYQEAQLINGVQMQLANEFRGTDNAICNLGFNTQQGFNQTNIALMQGQNALSTQIADCCCKTQSNLKDIQFQNAQDTCAVQNTIQNTTRDIIDNQNANSRQILDFLVNDKISTLQQENQNLKLAASQAAQNNYLLSELKPCPQPAYITCNPFTGQYGGYGYNGYNNGYGYNSGCGCNSGCCGCNG